MKKEEEKESERKNKKKEWRKGNTIRMGGENGVK